jgi:hypothetical protein
MEAGIRPQSNAFRDSVSIGTEKRLVASDRIGQPEPTYRHRSGALPGSPFQANFRVADHPSTLVGCLLHVLNQDGTAIYHNGLAGDKTFLH